MPARTVLIFKCTKFIFVPALQDSSAGNFIELKPIIIVYYNYLNYFRKKYIHPASNVVSLY